MNKLMRKIWMLPWDFGRHAGHFDPLRTSYSLSLLDSLSNLIFSLVPRLLGLPCLSKQPAMHLPWTWTPLPIGLSLEFPEELLSGWMAHSKCSQVPITKYFNMALSYFISSLGQKCAYLKKGILLGIQLVPYHLASTCLGNFTFHNPIPALSKQYYHHGLKYLVV